MLQCGSSEGGQRGPHQLLGPVFLQKHGHPRRRLSFKRTPAKTVDVQARVTGTNPAQLLKEQEEVLKNTINSINIFPK